IDGLPKGESSSEEGKNKESAIGSVVKEVSELLEKLITAGKEVVKVDFGDGSIGNVVAQADGGAADKDSVNGIAKGIKGIVEAAGGKLDAVAAATTETGKDAGKLFGNNGGGNAAAADASKAAAAISGVSGEQILKQIVAAAGKEEQNGAGAANATNPIAAAIGTAEAGAAFNAEGMKKDDQIAAAIVLRGMAKDGKFGLQNADDANGKGGVKNAVESAVKKTLDSLTLIVQKAIGDGLKKVSDSVKAAGKADANDPKKTTTAATE
uniref:variable large family protein n=1 Tax=Borreliella bavariensis TaxID=664662 RepID=UPI001CB6F37F